MSKLACPFNLKDLFLVALLVLRGSFTSFLRGSLLLLLLVLGFASSILGNWSLKNLQHLLVSDFVLTLELGYIRLLGCGQHRQAVLGNGCDTVSLVIDSQPVDY